MKVGIIIPYKEDRGWLNEAKESIARQTYAGEGNIKVVYEATQLCIVFIPFATYRRAGDIVKVTVLGVPVYRRIGDLVNCCGIQYHAT